MLLRDTKETKHSSRDIFESFLFVLPLLGFALVFILFPLIGTFANSMFRDVTFLERQFVFFENYRALFVDPNFWTVFRFTLFFVLVSVPLELAIGLIFALLMNLSIPGRGILRVCVLIPWAIPAVVSARIWELIYNYSYGLANFLCVNVGLTQQPVNWLGTNAGAFFSLVIADVWKTVPFVAIILLVGIQSIPEELYEQAKIDRANFFQSFTKITLPLLKPVIIVALLFRSIDAFRIFDLIYVLTHGGPGGSTTSLSLYGYKYFLVGDFGYGSAVSVILFLVSFALSVCYIKFGRFSKVLT